jgi:hypothetical protein
MKDILEEALEICAEYEDIDANGNANDWMRVSMLITEAMQYAKKQHIGEPVAWRLRRDDVDYGVTAYDKAQVGRYMQDGWQLVGELYTTPQPVVPEGFTIVPDEFINVLDNAPYINPNNYDHDQVCELNAAVREALAMLSAGKENDTHKHTAAILTEKWDDKTVTSAPFCLVCGESPLVGKGG